MAKLRFEITKDEEIRFISHLDYAGAIERAIRRAKLPAAYSEGFNPHMKIAFASALAVGVTSSFEYMDLELKQEIPVDSVLLQLTPKLPPGIRVLRGKYMPDRTEALMSIVNLASYRVTLTLKANTLALLEESISKFNAEPSLLYTRKNLKGTKEIEVKEYLAQDISFQQTGQEVELLLNIKIKPTGSIKPGEVLAALINSYDIPVDAALAVIHRQGLYVETGNTKLTPLEVSK